ncbi:VWA domain-containing protein [Chloroflexi bacterium TSY]|nr:VWA domain-containing protein [Chloroflexi bacterium TSY]
MSECPESSESPLSEQTFAPGKAVPIALTQPPHQPRKPLSPPPTPRGKRLAHDDVGQNGYYVRAAKPQGVVRDIALGATLRAAALRYAASFAHRLSWFPEDSATEQQAGLLPSFQIRAVDLHVKVRRQPQGQLILFVVDSSGSMAARKRMVAVKEVIVGLLLDAYQKRELVGMIAFRGQQAQLLVPPTNSVETAERQLRHLPTGGRTPLGVALQLADQVLASYLRRQSALRPLLVLVTDGRSNAGFSPLTVAHSLVQQKIPTLVLDSEQGYVKLGLARRLADVLGAHYAQLDDVSVDGIRRQLSGQTHVVSAKDR